MKLRTMLVGGLGAAALIGPMAAAAPATAQEDKVSLEISGAELVNDRIVVQGVYKCDQPFKVRFITGEAQQFQGEDGETEVNGIKSLQDRPCTDGKRRFQVTLAAGKGKRFLSADNGGSNVFVQVEVTITDEHNRFEDELREYADVAV